MRISSPASARTRKRDFIFIVFAALATSTRVVGEFNVDDACNEFFSLMQTDDGQPSTGSGGGKRSKSATASLIGSSSKSKPSGGSDDTPPSAKGEGSCKIFFGGLKKGYSMFVEEVAGEDGIMTESEFMMSPLISHFTGIMHEPNWIYSLLLDSNGDGAVAVGEVPTPPAEVAPGLDPQNLMSMQNMLETTWTVYTGINNAMVLSACDMDGDTVLSLSNTAEIVCFYNMVFGKDLPILQEGVNPYEASALDMNSDGLLNLWEVNLATFKHFSMCKAYLAGPLGCYIM